MDHLENFNKIFAVEVGSFRFHISVTEETGALFLCVNNNYSMDSKRLLVLRWRTLKIVVVVLLVMMFRKLVLPLLRNKKKI